MSQRYEKYQIVSHCICIKKDFFSVFSGIKKFPFIRRHCTEYKVLGFDCEWVTVGGARRPVALLQLASHRGLCALFRLCHLQRIPPELKVRYYGLANIFDDCDDSISSSFCITGNT